MNRFGVSEITEILNQFKLQTGLSGSLLSSTHCSEADTRRQHRTCPVGVGTHPTLSTISTTSKAPWLHPLFTFPHIHFDQKNYLGSSLCCNTAAGSSLKRHLRYVHSVMSAKLLTCEMSIAAIAIKAKMTPTAEHYWLRFRNQDSVSGENVNWRVNTLSSYSRWLLTSSSIGFSWTDNFISQILKQIRI